LQVGIVAFWVLLAQSVPAYADPAPKAAIVVVGKTANTKEGNALALELRQTMAERPEVELIAAEDEEHLFRSSKPEGTKKQKASLDAAKKHLEDASEALNGFDLQNAVKSVTKARSALNGLIGLRAAVALDRQRLQLAVSIAHAQRDERGLTALLAEYALRYPNEPPEQGTWPPDIIASLKTIALKSSVLSVKSEPSATVFVDGREIGSSPVRLGALPAGEHRVELVKPGYWPLDQEVETVTGQEALVEATLSPSLSAALKSASASKGLTPELEQNIRSAAPSLAVLIVAGVEDGKLVVRRVGLDGSSSDGPTEMARGEVTAARMLVGQIFDRPAGASFGKDVPLWAWIGAGSGVVAVGVGVTMRLLAVGTANEYDAKLGALTQVEAYELRDRSSTQATGGAVLLGLGVAAIAGVAGMMAFDLGPSG
jgi:hypothetical protein